MKHRKAIIRGRREARRLGIVADETLRQARREYETLRASLETRLAEWGGKREQGSPERLHAIADDAWRICDVLEKASVAARVQLPAEYTAYGRQLAAWVEEMAESRE